MASEAPFTSSLVLNYPPDDGLAAVDHSATFSGVFESKNTFKYILTGSGTQTVDFGTITADGAKAVQVEVEPDASPSAAPVNLQFNGGGASGQLEVSPGGSVQYVNPKPSAGLLSMDIVYTTDAVVRVRVLG